MPATSKLVSGSPNNRPIPTRRRIIILWVFHSIRLGKFQFPKRTKIFFPVWDFCYCHSFNYVMNIQIDPGGRAVSGVGLRPLACWDCGFESSRRYGCLSWVFRVVRYRSLRRADHSSRGVLPSVVCPMSVIAKPRKVRPWHRIGPKRQRAKIWKYKQFFSWILGSVIAVFVRCNCVVKI
jgi:hypothetical protein